MSNCSRFTLLAPPRTKTKQFWFFLQSRLMVFMSRSSPTVCHIHRINPSSHYMSIEFHRSTSWANCSRLANYAVNLFWVSKCWLNFVLALTHWLVLDSFAAFVVVYDVLFSSGKDIPCSWKGKILWSYRLVLVGLRSIHKMAVKIDT